MSYKSVGANAINHTFSRGLTFDLFYFIKRCKMSSTFQSTEIKKQKQKTNKQAVIKVIAIHLHFFRDLYAKLSRASGVLFVTPDTLMTSK